MRWTLAVLVLGALAAACDSTAENSSPACRYDVRADAAGEPTVRVFAVGFKQDLAAMRTYDDYRRILFGAVAQEAPCFSKTTPNLVVLPENSALMAAFIGSRGAKARAKTDTVGAFAEFFPAYKTPIEYYREKYPGLPGVRRLLLAMTDTLGRAISTTYPVLAKQYGIYLAVSVDVGEYAATTDPKLVAALGDPDLGGAGPAYVATSDKVYNVSIVYGPDGNELGRVRKAYLVPDERDLLQLNAGSLEQLRPIETPFGRLAPVTSKDGWMPDVLERFNEQGADITLQHEAFSGWAVEEIPGDWLPSVMMESVWSHVQAYDSFRYGVLPCITGNLLDMVFDCQSAITKEATGADVKRGFIGMPPDAGFLDIGAWASAVTERTVLRELGDALRPGSGDPRENAYVASTARGDLYLPGVKEQLRARKPAGGPALEGSPTGDGFTQAQKISGDGQTENAIRPDIAAAAGRLHLVWLRDQAGKRTAMYAGVTGTTLTQAVELPFVATAPYGLRVAAAGNTVYAVAVQDMGTEGRSRLPLVRSVDGGKTWYALPATFAGRGDWARWNPAIAASGEHVYIAWVDRRDGASDIYLAASHDRGGTWSTRRLDEPNAGEGIAADPSDVRNNQALPSLAVGRGGDWVAVSWIDFRDYAWDVYGSGSTDGARTFAANARWNGIESMVEGTEVERIFGVHAIAYNGRGERELVADGVTNRKPYHQVGMPLGYQPLADLCVECAPPLETGYRPHLGAYGSETVYVWQAATPSGNDVGVSSSRDGKWSAPTIFTAPGEQFNPRTAGGAVVWEDWRSGHGQIGLARLQ